jgi:hypothetical protein
MMAIFCVEGIAQHVHCDWIDFGECLPDLGIVAYDLFSHTATWVGNVSKDLGVAGRELIETRDIQGRIDSTVEQGIAVHLEGISRSSVLPRLSFENRDFYVAKVLIIRLDHMEGKAAYSDVRAWLEAENAEADGLESHVARGSGSSNCLVFPGV